MYNLLVEFVFVAISISTPYPMRQVMEQFVILQTTAVSKF